MVGAGALDAVAERVGRGERPEFFQDPMQRVLDGGPGGGELVLVAVNGGGAVGVVNDAEDADLDKLGVGVDAHSVGMYDLSQRGVRQWGHVSLGAMRYHNL